jgi:perosamine synthetase
MQNQNRKIKSINEKCKSSPGCMSEQQILAIKRTLKKAHDDPSIMCDIEGIGSVAELEKEFARICDTRFALSVSSGTAAIHAALLSCGIGPGDEVITTPYSWPQSVAPILFTGATPVFADINRYTFNLDPESVLNRISSKTRVILPVHLFGHSADMAKFEKIARDNEIVLISDAAHALGAKLQGRPIGSWGDITCFSLGRGKLVSGGEGGIIATNDVKIYERAVALTQHPERMRRIKGPKYNNKCFGLNYRIHPLSALLALCDLKNIVQKYIHRETIFRRFMKGLENTNYITPQLSLFNEDPAPYGIPLTFEQNNGREALVSQLQNMGVPLRCGPVRKPLHFLLSNSPKSHHTHLRGSCPVAEQRCSMRELWVLSALDMDGVSYVDAYYIGEKVGRIANSFLRSEN